MADLADDETRVKELEARIKRLESENKKLLNVVHQPIQQNGHAIPLDLDDPEDGLLDLDELLSDQILQIDEEWLYVSPRFPPTPEQRKVTPQQWLSEGLYDGDILSLDEVRRSLVKDIEAAEEIGEVHYESYHRKPLSTNTSAKESRPVKQRAKKVPPSNMSAELSLGPPSDNGSSEDIPVVKWRAKVPPSDDVTSEDVPIVKWKKPVIPSDEESSESIVEPAGRRRAKMPPSDGDIPVVRWKKPVIPSDEESSESVAEPAGRRRAKMPPSDEDIPVVKWKKPVIPSDEESSESVVEPAGRRRAKMPPSDGDIPVVKWKKPVIPSDEESSESIAEPAGRRRAKMPPSDEDVPIVKWKKPVVPSDKEPSGGSSQDVPVVKWKKPVIPSGGEPTAESVPVVKWKAKLPPQSSPESSSSTVNQKMRNTAKHSPPSSADIPVVHWKAKSPTESPARNSSSPESLESQKSNSRTKPSPSESMLKRRLVKKEGLKVPADSKRKSVSPEDSDVPVRKYKVKMPANSRVQENKPAVKQSVAAGKGKMKLSPQQHNSRAALSTSNSLTNSSASPGHREEHHSASATGINPRENSAATNSHDDTPSELFRASRLTQHESNGSLSSDSSLPTRRPSTDDVTQKPSSRRSSFSDSRSPSPPSIAPHIRMAIGSPVSRRRTPSPAPARAAANLNRQSPSHSPALHQKQLQLLSGARLSAGIPTPSSKLRSPHGGVGSGLAKGGNPMRGLTPPSDRKRRLLPASPGPTDNSRVQGVVRRDASEGQKTASPSVSQVPPGPGTAEGDWLEGCF